MNPIWEVGLGTFLLVTVILGGGAAYLTGRAVALTWRPWPQFVAYVVGLTFSVRFVHYALFGGNLLSVQYAIVDFVVLLFFSWLGFQICRSAQMANQYSWLYRRATPLSWREKPRAGQSP
jgi:hypothetical protein